MNDWLGLAFFILLIVGLFCGLKLLSKPQKRTEQEFERNAAEGSTMLGAYVGGLQELMNPTEAKAKETIMQLKTGRYNKKKREGKANGVEEDLNEENND